MEAIDHRPPTVPAPPADAESWSALEEELDQWAASGLHARFWWRDDDAVDAGPRLRSLLDVAGTAGAIVALAVVPERASDALARLIEGSPAVVWQHGCSHRDHAGPPRPSELGDERGRDVVVDELLRARSHMDEAFGSRTRPVLVPPWGHMSGQVAGRLAAVGYRAVSGHGRPLGHWRWPGLSVANTDVEPAAEHADWWIETLVEHLRERRRRAPQAPLGILSHHAEVDGRVLERLGALAVLVTDHSGARWISPDEVVEGAQ